jgi:hypothetical protein
MRDAPSKIGRHDFLVCSRGSDTAFELHGLDRLTLGLEAAPRSSRDSVDGRLTSDLGHLPVGDA